MVDERKIDLIKAGKPFKWVDFVIIGVVLAVSLTLVVFSYLNRKDTVYLQIIYKGVSAEYRLNIDREIRLEEHFVVKIKNGYAWVEESDCENQLCVRSGKIRYDKQMIVCLPKNIVIKIVDEAGGGLIPTG